MAVLTEVPGLEVRVKVEGELVPDYVNNDVTDMGPETHEHPRGNFYVEAKTGARYRVQVDVAEPFFSYLHAKKGKASSLRVELWIDGKKSHVMAHSQFCDLPYTFCDELRSSRQHSEDEYITQDLAFGVIDRVEDSDPQRVIAETDIARAMGDIEVRIDIGNAEPTLPATNSPPLPSGSPFEFSEKALKDLDITHGTRLAAQSQVETIPTVMFEAIKTICVVKISYRSREMLQSLKVIAGPQSDEPDFAAMSHEELLAFVQQNWQAPEDTKKE